MIWTWIYLLRGVDLTRLQMGSRLLVLEPGIRDVHTVADICHSNPPNKSASDSLWTYCWHQRTYLSTCCSPLSEVTFSSGVSVYALHTRDVNFSPRLVTPIEASAPVKAEIPFANLSAILQLNKEVRKWGACSLVMSQCQPSWWAFQWHVPNQRLTV